MTPPSYMDLIYMAKQNAENNEKEASRLSDTIRGKNKNDPKQIELAEKIKRFKKKKEAEDRRKLEVAREKRDKLLENRDNKDKNRIKRMLHLTKSSNKAAFTDNKESTNERIAAQLGIIQPDEDDYGYTSSFAQKFHQKFVNDIIKDKDIEKASHPKTKKAHKIHLEVPKSFSLMSNKPIKETTVPEVVQKEIPSTSKNIKHNNNNNSKDVKKKKKPPPDIPSFQDLMDLAKEKCKEPFSAPLTKSKTEREEFECGRPMTSKEKEAFLLEKKVREKISKNQFTLANKESATNKINQGIDKAKITVNSNNEKQGFKIPNNKKKNDSQTTLLEKSNSQINKSSGSSNIVQNKIPDKNSLERKENHQNTNNFKEQKNYNGNQNNNGKSQKPPPQPPLIKNTNKRLDSQSSSHSSSKPHHGSGTNKSQNRDTNTLNYPIKKNIYKKEPPREKEHSFKKPAVPAHYNEKQDLKRKLPPNKPIKREPEDFHIKREPEDYYPEERPIKREKLSMPPNRRPSPPPNRRPEKPRRPVIESDEEYDSEMDDFIDDTDHGGLNISDEIRSIFGYDRNRYSTVSDDDDDIEEASFDEVLEEEKHSLKEGIREDQEDMLLEELENKRKAILKKKKMREMKEMRERQKKRF